MTWYKKLGSLVRALVRLDTRKLESGYVYFTYYTLGGAIVSKRVPPALKYVLYLYNAIIIVVCLVAAPTYHTLILMKSPSPLNVSECVESFIQVGVIATITFSPVVTLFFYKDIEAILTYFDKDHSADEEIDGNANAAATKSDTDYTRWSGERYQPDSHWSSEVQGIQLMNVVKVTGIVQIYIATSSMCFYVIPAVYVLFAYDGKPNLLRHHVLPIPFYDCAITQEIYHLVLFVEVLLTLPLTVSASVMAAMLVIITARMNNIVYYFCRRIRRFSNVVSEHLRKSHLLDGEIGRDTSYVHQTKDLYKLVNDHQDLTRHLAGIRPFVDFLCTLYAITAFLMQLSAIYLLLGTNEPNDIKFKQLILAASLTILIFIVGYVGKTFHDMNDAVRYEVYNIPWYHMHVKTRRIVHIFQNMVLRDWKFHVIFVYPMSMSLPVSFSKSVFSYFNLLRTVLNRNPSSHVSLPRT